MTSVTRLSLVALLIAAPVFAQSPINLPSSKQLLPGIPGDPQRINSLPLAMAWSPDHRYLAVVNAGYGTAESNYQQSIAVLDTQTGNVKDFPESRTTLSSVQTLFSGLLFSADGRHLYASLDSLSAPEGGEPGKDGLVKTGNAIAVYSFHDGSIAADRLIPIPLQQLAPGRSQNEIGKPMPMGKAIPVPTGLALLKAADGAEQLLVADNFSDDVLQVDAASSKVLRRFDLATKPIVPANYPIAIAVDAAQRFAYVALWNGSGLAQLDLKSGKVASTLPLLPPDPATGPSSHPCALVFSKDGQTLYVALANRDAVAAVSLANEKPKLTGTLDTRLPGQSYFGAIPTALALSSDGSRLFVANSGSNAVAVFDTAQKLSATTPVHATGFLPTEWFPTAVAVQGNKLYAATGKGKGTGPNAPKPLMAADPSQMPAKFKTRAHAYIATLLHGSLASIDLSSALPKLDELSRAVVLSNRMNAEQQHVFADGHNPIKHVIYIIKENRTYDQILGDLGVGEGDSSLTMYGKDITPNQHKLALQFGVLDNFYDSGEVSGDGHVWSTAAITSDYNEKNWQQSYRGKERTYDYEGVVAEGYPLLEGISDIDEPQSGYIWTNLARHGKSLYHFGEFVSTKFCDDSGEAPKDRSPLNGTPEPAPQRCAGKASILPGQEIPASYGGGASEYQWHIPLIFKNTATKPEIEGHFDTAYPDFNLKFPDQLRVSEFITQFDKWVTERKAGTDNMPQFIMLRMGDDHTAGTTVGSPTPRSSVADNDLAVGRAVEALSHSPYWDDTAFFILEDDAQDGADHVDGHRSIALVVSKYSPRNPEPFIDHSFYTTVSVLHTMEDLLGVPPMNNNDAFAPLIAPIFGGKGDQPAYSADYTNRDNKLIYQANTPKAPGAKQSSKMDFTHEDRADARLLNIILWRDAMGNKPVPQMVLHPHGQKKDDDDD